MSEKGLLSKSIANNIGEAIIDKLGGTGYAPTEWSKNINLLGIASADIEEALASITEDASSSDKGLLSLSIASDMGAMLNKKYNTSRGFKPSEVSSAVSALIPLPEKTTPSGSIAHITDGADEVPVKSWGVTLGASLSGYSSLNCYAYGKNLIDLSSLVFGYVKTNGTFETGHSNGEMRSGFIPVKPDTTYYFSIFETTGTAADWVGIGEYTTNDTSGFVRCDSYWRFTTGSTTKYIVVSARNLEQATKIQLEVGNDLTTWEAYQAPTTHTASLGRTIYGGTADVVKGEGTEEYANTSLTDKNYYYSSSMKRFDCNLDGVISSGYMDDFIPPQGYTIDHALIIDGANAPDYTMCIFGGKLYIKNLSCSSVSELVSDMSGKYITYPLATSTAFTFTPITPTPETALGVNNFWADEGDSEVTYRADLDLYEAPSMLLEANNTETEGNEEQEGNE